MTTYIKHQFRIFGQTVKAQKAIPDDGSLPIPQPDPKLMERKAKLAKIRASAKAIMPCAIDESTGKVVYLRVTPHGYRVACDPHEDRAFNAIQAIADRQGVVLSEDEKAQIADALIDNAVRQGNTTRPYHLCAPLPGGGRAVRLGNRHYIHVLPGKLDFTPKTSATPFYDTTRPSRWDLVELLAGEGYDPAEFLNRFFANPIDQVRLFTATLVFDFLTPAGEGALYPVMNAVEPWSGPVSCVSWIIQTLFGEKALVIDIDHYECDLLDLQASCHLLMESGQRFSSHLARYVRGDSPVIAINHPMFRDMPYQRIDEGPLERVLAFALEPVVAPTITEEVNEDGDREICIAGGSTLEFLEALPEEQASLMKGILELSANILAVLPTIPLDSTHAMPEFMQWLSAYETVMGLEPGELHQAFHINQQAVRDQAAR